MKYGLLLTLLLLFASISFAVTGCGVTYTNKGNFTITSTLSTSVYYTMPIVLNSSSITYSTNKEWLCFELQNSSGVYPLYYHIDQQDWNTSGETLAFTNITTLPANINTTIMVYSGNTTAANVSWYNPYKIFLAYDNATGPKDTAPNSTIWTIYNGNFSIGLNGYGLICENGGDNIQSTFNTWSDRSSRIIASWPETGGAFQIVNYSSWVACGQITRSQGINWYGGESTVIDENEYHGLQKAWIINHNSTDASLYKYPYILNATGASSAAQCGKDNVIFLGNVAGMNITYISERVYYYPEPTVTLQEEELVPTGLPSLAIAEPVNTTYNYTNIDVEINSNGSTIWYNWNGTNTTYTVPVTVIFPQGPINLTAYANNTAGNQTEVSVIFWVDSIWPTITIVSPTATTYPSATQTVEITSNGAYTWYNWNGTNTNYTSPVSVTFPAGSNTLYAYTNDSTGNTNSSSVTFTILSNNLPSLTINSPLNQSYNTTSILLNLTTNGSSAWYNWNGTNSTNYTVPYLVVFPQGGTTLTVWANNSAGNVTSTYVVFWVDSIWPTLSIESPSPYPPYEYSVSGILVNITSNGAYTWFNWNGTNSVYTGTETVYFPDGTNTITTYTNDSTGNTNSTSIIFKINTSVISSSLTINSPLNQSYNTTQILVNITSNGSSVWYNWNGSTTGITACSGVFQNVSNITIQNTINDDFSYAIPILLNSSLITYTSDIFSGLCFELNNASGKYPLWYALEPFDWNTSGNSLVFLNLTQFRNSNQTVSIYSNGSSTIIYNNPFKVFSLYDNFTGAPGSAPNGNWTSTWALGGNGYGLIGTGAYGVGTSTSSTNTYTTNNTVRIIREILDGATEVDFQNKIYLLWGASNDAGQLKWALTNSSTFAEQNYTKFGSSSDLRNVSTQPNLGRSAWAIARNSSDTNLYWYPWTLNATNISSTGGTNDKAIVFSTNSNSTINWTYVAVFSYRYPEPSIINYTSIQPASIPTGNTTYTIPVTVTFTQGPINLTAWANNTAGNQTEVSVIFWVDSIRPNITIETPTATTYTNTTILVNITSDGDYIWYNWNGTNTAYTVPVLVNFPQGVTTLIAYANDTLGNANSDSVTFNISVDLPSLSINSPQNTSYNTTAILVNITSNGSTIWYNWNGTNTTYTAAGIVYFPQGGTTLTVWANNSAGNVTSTSVTFWVDSRTPTINISSPLAINYTSSATILVNITSNGDYIWYNWNGTNTAYTVPVYVTFPQGSTTLNAYANMSTSNANSTSVTFFVNTSSEQLNLTLFNPLNKSYFTKTIPYSFTITNTTLTSAHCWQDFDGTTTNFGNLSIGSTHSGTVTAQIGGHYITILCQQINGTNATQTVYFDVKAYEINATNFEPTVLETNTSIYNLSIYFADFVTNAAFSFVYNNTTYTVTNTSVGQQKTILTSFGAPLLQANATLMNFYWQGNLTYSNGTVFNTSNFSNGTQRIDFAYGISSITANTSLAFEGDIVLVNVTLWTKLPYTNINASGHLWPTSGFQLSNTTYSLWQGIAAIPVIAGSSGSVNISSYVTFTSGSESRFNTSANLTLTVYRLILTNCSAGSPSTTVFLNFTHVDEFRFVILNGSDEVTFTVWNNQRTAGRNYSFNFTNVPSFIICLYPADTSVKIDSIHTYTATTRFTENATNNLTVDYYPREYFLRNLNISNLTTYINLYSINKTFPYTGSQPSRVEFQVVEAADNGNSKNTILQIRKYVPANNTYITVAMIQTDHEGKANTYLLPFDPIYKISFIREDLSTGELESQEKIQDAPTYGTSDGVALFYKKLTLPAPGSVDYYSLYKTWIVDCSTANSTGVWCNLKDITMASRTWNLTLEYYTSENMKFLYCQNSTTGQDVILSCMAPVGIGNYTYTVSMIITDAAGVVTTYVLDQKEHYSGRPNFGTEGIIAALLLFGIMAGAGSQIHPVAAVLFGMLAFVIAAYLGFFTPAGSLPAILISILVVAGIVIWKAMGK
jgi:hypothetical protein